MCGLASSLVGVVCAGYCSSRETQNRSTKLSGWGLKQDVRSTYGHSLCESERRGRGTHTAHLFMLCRNLNLRCRGLCFSSSIRFSKEVSQLLYVATLVTPSACCLPLRDDDRRCGIMTIFVPLTYTYVHAARKRSYHVILNNRTITDCT